MCPSDIERRDKVEDPRMSAIRVWDHLSFENSQTQRQQGQRSQMRRRRKQVPGCMGVCRELECIMGQQHASNVLSECYKKILEKP